LAMAVAKADPLTTEVMPANEVGKVGWMTRAPVTRHNACLGLEAFGVWVAENAEWIPG